MREQTPSLTAMGTAYMRALHMAVDEAPYIFEDAAASSFLPAAQQRQLEWLGSLAERWRSAWLRRPPPALDLATQVLVRARYTEEALAAAVARGCRRYVILGAGLDTYAQRHAADPDPLPVIEIDHPATQSWKRRWMADHGLPEPPAASYRPVDFERNSLDSALEPGTPQFISWLGTTYYLTRSSVVDTLTRLAGLSAPGSELVLDYWRDSRLPDPRALAVWGAKMFSSLQPEPLRSFFDPHDMEVLVRQAGWQVREHCAPDIQNARYLAGRADRRHVPAFAFMIHLEK